MRFILLLLIIAAASPVMAKGIRVKVVDANGNPFPKVLTIVQGLNVGRELGRFLSDENGLTPEVQISDEIFRVIATCPYGLCRTSVHEFISNGSQNVVTITAEVGSSDENGIPVGFPKLKLLLDRPSERTAGAKILVRDPFARWEHWYVADKEGSVEVEMVYEPSVVVVFFAGRTYVNSVSPCASDQSRFNSPRPESSAKTCKPVVLRLRDD